jgi:hypothetical protein
MFRAYGRLPIILVLLAATLVSTAEADVLDPATMKAVLRAVTPEQEAFIDNVLVRVKKGILPLELVQSTFLWAKKKPRHRFYYFKQALTVRAAKQGIKL